MLDESATKCCLYCTLERKFLNESRPLQHSPFDLSSQFARQLFQTVLLQGWFPALSTIPVTNNSGHQFLFLRNNCIKRRLCSEINATYATDSFPLRDHLHILQFRANTQHTMCLWAFRFFILKFHTIKIAFVSLIKFLTF